MSESPNEAFRIALVVEGGGMRGVYAAGVLDSFAHAGLDPFNLYFGVSSGAMNLLSFLSGQQGRNREVYNFCASHPEFINMKNFASGGHYLDLDWMWENTLKEIPLDTDEMFTRLQDKKTFMVCCTNIENGEPVYFCPDEDNYQELLTASSAVPLIYRGPIEFQGMKLVDGGVTDPIPVKEAVARGAKHVVVIRTRQASYSKSWSLTSRLSAMILNKYPALAEAIKNQYKVYNETLEYIANPPEHVNIIHISATEKLKTSRTCTKTALLQQDYELGKKDGDRIVNILAKTLHQKVVYAMAEMERSSRLN